MQSTEILKSSLQKATIDTLKTNILNLNEIANTYFKQNNNSKALEYYNKSLALNSKIKDSDGYAYCLSNIAIIYSKERQYPKAVNYFTKALDNYDKSQIDKIDNTLKQLSKTYLLLAGVEPKNRKKYIYLSTQTLERISSKQKQYSQSVEALKEQLQKTTVDTTKISLLNRLSSSYFYINPKEGIRYGEAALKLATKIKWLKGIALANDNLGVCQWVLTDYIKALNYFYKSLSTYKKLKDLNGISSTYNNLGLINVEIKKYAQAFIFFNQAFEINKKTGNKILMVYNLNNIAMAYYNQKKYAKALEYYSKSKVLNESMNDLNGLAYCYAKIGTIYSDQNDYAKGLDYYKKALRYLDKGQSYNIGNTYLEMGITFHKMALVNPNNTAQLLTKSVIFLNKSLKLFIELGVLDKQNSCYFELYKILKEQGNYSDALTYFDKYTSLKDSINLNENENKIANILSTRKIELKDKKIEIQNLKIKNAFRKVYLLVTITGIVAILLIVFFWLYITKRNVNYQLVVKNKIISNINNQKDKFFSIIANDLRGPFNGFLGLTELLAEDLDSMNNDEIKLAAVTMKNSATNLNRLLENLLEWSRMEQGLIPFAPQEIKLKAVVSECIATFEDAAKTKEITINTEISTNTMVFADNNILHAIIRNILSNAVKFTPHGGKIVVHGEEDENKTTISITDSGIGMNTIILENLFRLNVQTNRKSTNEEPSTGLGLILCKEFVEKHGGKIWAKSEEKKGTTFFINLPKH